MPDKNRERYYLEALRTAFPDLPTGEPVEIPWGRRPEATWGILIHPSVDGEDKLWHPDAGGWVASISPEQIADVVRTKARTAQVARTRCDKLWLVIVNESFGRAAPAEISE